MKVRGLIEEKYFEEIFVSKKANFHSVCKFRQRIAKDKIFTYQNAVGKKISVELDDGRPIFFGEVVETLVEQNFGGSYAEIQAVSDSIKIDEKTETRIFQNPDKTFSEIINSARLQISDCKITLDEKFSAQKCEEIILQNHETNFNFMNRLALWKSQRVWIKDTVQNKSEIKISPCANNSDQKILSEEIISLKVGRRGKIKIAELITQKYFELGNILNFKNNGKFLIIALEVYQENGVDRIKYCLEEFKEIAACELCSVAPVKLTAKILDVKDDKNFGRVKVQFDIDDKDSKKSWIPYRTPYSGFIFLPEKGDIAEIFYTCGECFVNSILRTKILDSEITDVEKEKFIGNNFKQRIILREKSLEIKSGETSIFMDDKKIILTAGKNKITLDESGITAKTDGDLKSEVTKNFSVKVGKNFIAESSSDISFKSNGKFIAKSRDAAQIGGSSVELG